MFTYSDYDEQHHTVGPWGASEPLDGSFHEVRIGLTSNLLQCFADSQEITFLWI
jgi:hypothetical protein